jgi:hypothetical protein
MRDKVAEIDGAHKEKQAQLKAVQGRLGQLRKSQGLLEQRERLELAAVWAVVREREEVRGRGVRGGEIGGVALDGAYTAHQGSIYDISISKVAHES